MSSLRPQRDKQMPMAPPPRLDSDDSENDESVESGMADELPEGAGAQSINAEKEQPVVDEEDEDEENGRGAEIFENDNDASDDLDDLLDLDDDDLRPPSSLRPQRDKQMPMAPPPSLDSDDSENDESVESDMADELPEGAGAESINAEKEQPVVDEEDEDEENGRGAEIFENDNDASDDLDDLLDLDDDDLRPPSSLRPQRDKQMPMAPPTSLDSDDSENDESVESDMADELPEGAGAQSINAEKEQPVVDEEDEDEENGRGAEIFENDNDASDDLDDLLDLDDDDLRPPSSLRPQRDKQMPMAPPPSLDSDDSENDESVESGMADELPEGAGAESVESGMADELPDGAGAESVESGMADELPDGAGAESVESGMADELPEGAGAESVESGMADELPDGAGAESVESGMADELPDGAGAESVESGMADELPDGAGAESVESGMADELPEGAGAQSINAEQEQPVVDEEDEDEENGRGTEIFENDNDGSDDLDLDEIEDDDLRPPPTPGVGLTQKRGIANLDVANMDPEEFGEIYQELIETCHDLDKKEGIDETFEEKMSANIETGKMLFEQHMKGTAGGSQPYEDQDNRRSGFTTDMNLAFFHAKLTSTVLRNKAEQLGSAASIFSVDKFIESLKREFVDQDGVYSAQLAAANIAMEASAGSKSLRPLVAVVGTYDREEAIIPKAKRQRSSIKRPIMDEPQEGNGFEDNSADNMQVAEKIRADTVAKTMNKILKVVHASSAEPINLYEFAIDRKSFPKTVENIFYMSFLVKDGHASLSKEAQGKLNNLSLTIKPEKVQRQETNQQEDEESTINQTHRHKYILSFSPRLWKELCEASSGEDVLSYYQTMMQRQPGTGMPAPNNENE